MNERGSPDDYEEPTVHWKVGKSAPEESLAAWTCVAAEGSLAEARSEVAETWG
jgi:hypothetical protein